MRVEAIEGLRLPVKPETAKVFRSAYGFQTHLSWCGTVFGLKSWILDPYDFNN